MTEDTRDTIDLKEGKPTPQELEQARRDALRLKMTRRKLGLAGRIGRGFLESKLTPLIIVASLLLGGFALLVTPSEEEPQIKVPMIDVMVGFPGATAEEIEHRVITPLEKLLYEIENVEYIYSISRPSGGFIVVRFLVGTDPDQAAVRVHNKIASVMDELPEGLVPPVVKPRTIDDVPVVAYTLWGKNATSTELRRVADELKVEITKHPRVAQVWVIGGQRRVVRVDFDRERLASFNVSLLQAYQAMQSVNWRLPAGSTAIANTEVLVDVGEFLADADDVGNVVVSASGGRPVYLKDVAEIMDGPEEPGSYVWLGSGPGAPEKGLERAGLDLPAVTLSVAKKPGTNAVDMVTDIDRVLARLEGRVIPSNIEILKTRDYGATAKEKSDELLTHLWSATLAVILLMWITLSRREAIVVAVVIPVTLALTLAASYFFGYTLNRVSLFALVFSIGILVDDAIVVVENIHRHIQLRWGKAKQATIYAVDEVGNPTILATFAIISALMPLAFVRGLMGPYMRPIPINASAAMLFSLGVAFTISPWLAYRLFKKEAASGKDAKDSHADHQTVEDSFLSRIYHRLMQPLDPVAGAALSLPGRGRPAARRRHGHGRGRFHHRQDAAPRQQVRGPGRHRRARGLHPGTDQRGGPRARRRLPHHARGHRLPGLCRHFGAVQLQRPRPALLPPLRRQRRRYPGQFRPQGETRSSIARSGQKGPRHARSGGRTPRRDPQGRRDPTRPAGDVHPGGRDLRTHHGRPARDRRPGA